MAEALEYDFIEEPSEDFHCPVTLEVLTEPHQTLCCGNHLSQKAANRLKQEGKPCPICKQPNLNTVHDKFFKRMVNQLKVRCSKKALGCDWVGELGDLERHLSVGSVDGECKFVTVACPLSCGDDVQRDQLEGHKSEECPQRPCTCEHCGLKATYKSVTEDHWPRCEKYPLQCPNKCRENTIKRQHLQKHLDNVCPLQVIECEFSYAGCEAKLQRRYMEKHLNENMKTHLSMASKLIKQNKALTSQVQALTSAIKSGTLTPQQATPPLIFHPPPEGVVTEFEKHQQKQIETMMSVMNYQQIRIEALVTALNKSYPDIPKPPSPVFIPPPVFVMNNFEKHKQNDNDMWYSPPFYSHIGGYKLCIGVSANGWGNKKGTHVGVFIRMMRGEYDDNLKWPFKGEVKVQFLNQRGDKGHLERAPLELSHYSLDHFYKSKYVGRVVGREIAEEGWGLAGFISHTDLAYNRAKDCQYLMNDWLKFRITKIELLP